ncbi:MAG: hypothetical protein AB1689_13720 [Thermodesulfobacteriota bacterium]
MRRGRFRHPRRVSLLPDMTNPARVRTGPVALFAIRLTLELMFPEARITRLALPRASQRWAGYRIVLPNACVTLAVARSLLESSAVSDIAAALARSGLVHVRQATSDLTVYVRSPKRGLLRVWFAGVRARRPRTPQ